MSQLVLLAFHPFEFELVLHYLGWHDELDVVNLDLLSDQVRLLNARLVIIVYVPVNRSELAGCEPDLGAKRGRFKGAQVNGLGLLQDQDLGCGRELDLNIQHVGLRCVDQQDLKEDVVLVHRNEGFRIERIEIAGQLDHGLQLIDKVLLLFLFIKNLIDFFIIELFFLLKSFLQLPKEDKIRRIFLEDLDIPMGKFLMDNGLDILLFGLIDAIGLLYELLWADDLSDQRCDLINCGLVYLIDVLLVVPE